MLCGLIFLNTCNICPESNFIGLNIALTTFVEGYQGSYVKSEKKHQFNKKLADTKLAMVLCGL